jgi:hypothetical protein
MKEENKLFFKNKKSFFICIFMLFVTVASFADIHIIWSTVRPTVEGVNTRLISRSSVNTEFFRNWNEYPFILFGNKNIHNRSSYASTSEYMIGLMPLESGPGFRQFSNWLNSNQNFAFAYSNDAVSDIIIICFVTGNRVYDFIFNNSGNGRNTNNMELKSNLETLINRILVDINDFIF